MSAQVLVHKLQDRNPDAELYFTASTLTGYQTAARLFANSSIHLGYFPYDCIWAVRNVCSKIRPSQVIITETDIWPTFLWEMRRQGVPVSLVNLRLSDRTWNTYRRLRWLVKSIYACFEQVCVQTPSEKDRLLALNLPSHRIHITGNLKFDGLDWKGATPSGRSLFDELKVPKGHRIIVAGSTHEGEESALFEAMKPILSNDKQISLIVAPRDPGRSRTILSLCKQFQIDSCLLSRLSTSESDPFPQAVIVDTIGLLKDLYRLADLAFVGGSMVCLGGHNPLEPAFWGKPVLFGQDMSDFALIADYLLTSGGAMQVKDVDQLQAALRQLLDNPNQAKRMGHRALTVVNAHRGAVDRTLSHLELTGEPTICPEERHSA